MKLRPFRSIHRVLPVLAIVVAFPLSARAQTWTRIRTETASDLVAVHFADARNGFIAGAFGTLLKTTDGGNTWTALPAPANVSFVSVAARSAEEFFTGRVGLYRTGDSGAHWDQNVGGFEASPGSIFDILFTSAATGFLTKEGTIQTTTNGGTEWTQVADTGLFLDDLHYPGGQTLFATGGITYSEVFGLVSRADIARSRDGGVTWDTMQPQGMNEIHAAVWESDQKGTLFTFTNKAHYTTDGGDTWELLTAEMQDTRGRALPSIIMDAVMDSAGHFVAVDFAGNFLESTDAVTWQINEGSGEPFSALTKLPDGTLIAVGNSGNIWMRSQAAPPVALPLAIQDIRYDPEKKQIILDATGTPGTDYSVEFSTDLASWEGVQSFKPDDAKFSVAVDAPASGGRAYFRIAESRRGVIGSP